MSHLLPYSASNNRPSHLGVDWFWKSRMGRCCEVTVLNMKDALDTVGINCRQTSVFSAWVLGWYMAVWHSGKVNDTKSARCHFYPQGPVLQLDLLSLSQACSLLKDLIQHTQTHTHTLALLCLQSKQRVTGECVSLLFVCSSLCTPWCLPLQNNRPVWENLCTGGLILLCAYHFPSMHCGSDCISLILL